VDVLRREGPRSLAFRVLGEIGYRRMIVMEREFDLSMPDVEAQVPATFAPLEPGDLGDYMRLRPDADPDDVRDRFRRRHVCFGAWLEGRLVQACWVGIERARVDYLGCWIQLGSGVGYLQDLYTEPELRGIGLHRSMYPHMFRYFRNTGSPAVVAAFQPENRVQRIFGRLGFRPVAIARVVRLGPVRRVWQQPLPDAGDGPLRFRVSATEEL
jgi:GNAT superfamily N-acetyltransferase